jgi:hypothetical protein
MLDFEGLVRRRVEHSLSYETCAVAAMRLGELEQFVAGVFRPTDDQLVSLALKLDVPIPPALAAAVMAARAAKRRAA